MNREKSTSGPQDFKLMKKEKDFESRPESTILIRERVRGSKFEGAYQKRKGTLLSQAEHTITILQAAKTRATILSERDVGRNNTDDQPCSSRQVDELLTKQQLLRDDVTKPTSRGKAS